MAAIARRVRVTPTIRALPFVLVATVGCTFVYAQQLTCYPIRSGETSASLARLLTGDPRNRYQPWFQIVEPATGRFISKRAYEHIQAGWHVCLGTEPPNRIEGQPASVFNRRAPAVVPQTALRPQAVRNFNFLWWATPLALLAGALSLGSFTARRIEERQLMVSVMGLFGRRFVAEFERPLFRKRAGDPVLNSRLRFAPRRRRLDILVAPPAGRTYPNLADHRNNVEYDVERILAQLDDRQFVIGPLYVEDEWVVIPFRFAPGMQQEDGQ